MEEAEIYFDAGCDDNQVSASDTHQQPAMEEAGKKHDVTYRDFSLRLTAWS
jgi:hypothetical protein